MILGYFKNKFIYSYLMVLEGARSNLDPSVTLYHRWGQVAFAALKKDGSVVTWGGHYLDLDLKSGPSQRLGMERYPSLFGPYDCMCIHIITVYIDMFSAKKMYTCMCSI